VNYIRDVPWGKGGEINVVIEIPKGSSNKYEYDEKGEYFRLDRTLHSAMFYPFDYGFLPQSIADDGDALDVIVLTEMPTFTGCVVRARPIGLLRMKDQAGEDIKLITVLTKKEEPRKAEIRDLKDLPEHVKKEIENFMQYYKSLEPRKWVRIEGFEGAEKARALVKRSVDDYKKE
jgi:inorganic pyrophosphatase